jgi:hypothetical protein
MIKRGNLTRFSLLIIGLFILALSIAYSAGSSLPEGPDSISVVNSSRHIGSSGAVTVQAEAGNVTSLRIINERATEAWQGYFGNVSGNITLEDSSDNLFFSWQLANPTGEVYASNSSTTPSWASVYCINVSQNGSVLTRPDGSVSSINGSQIELSYGINATDLDGLNETFTTFWSGTFRTGTITFDSTDGCSRANPYSAGGSNAIWDEVLLSDNQTLIFVSIIEENQASYKASSEPADFQMLVLENGHVGSETTTTPYYFYVELA